MIIAEILKKSACLYILLTLFNSLSLEAQEGYAFWLEENSKIFRMSISNGEVSLIYSIYNPDPNVNHEINGLVINTNQQRIYSAMSGNDSFLNGVFSIDFDGGDFQVHYEGENTESIPAPFEVNPFTNTIFLGSYKLDVNSEELSFIDYEELGGDSRSLDIYENKMYGGTFKDMDDNIFQKRLCLSTYSFDTLSLNQFDSFGGLVGGAIGIDGQTGDLFMGGVENFTDFVLIRYNLNTNEFHHVLTFINVQNFGYHFSGDYLYTFNLDFDISSATVTRYHKISGEKEIVGVVESPNLSVFNTFYFTAYDGEITNQTEDFDSRKVKIFPNPTSSNIVLSEISEPLTYNIHNSLGQLVLEGEQESSIIDLTDLQSGNYYVTIFFENEVIIKKIIKI